MTPFSRHACNRPPPHAWNYVTEKFNVAIKKKKRKKDKKVVKFSYHSSQGSGRVSE
jgi:hypothetical protein